MAMLDRFLRFKRNCFSDLCLNLMNCKLKKNRANKPKPQNANR
jgi:hypothetical protein